jgi:hypothetical protein
MAHSHSNIAIEDLRGQRTETRISWLTLAIGAFAAIVAAFAHNRLWAVGLAMGTGLAWANFRWLRRGMDAFVADSTAQSGAKKPRVPVVACLLMVFRYGLIALAVYATFKYLQVPLLSMVVGLCALGAATIAASVYEILRPVH